MLEKIGFDVIISSTVAPSIFRHVMLVGGNCPITNTRRITVSEIDPRPALMICLEGLTQHIK